MRIGSDVATAPMDAPVGVCKARSATGNAYPHSTPATVLTPVHRFCRPAMNTHFYIADEAERDTVRNTLGVIYQYEGPAFWVGQ